MTKDFIDLRLNVNAAPEQIIPKGTALELCYPDLFAPASALSNSMRTPVVAACSGALLG